MYPHLWDGDDGGGGEETELRKETHDQSYFKNRGWDFPALQWLRFRTSTAGARLIRGQVTKILRAVWPKN